MNENINKISIIKRLGALLYDMIILFSILLIATGIISIPYELLTGAPVYTKTLPLIFMRLYLIAVVISFYIYFWTHGGQTLGLRAWHLQVVDENNKILDVRAALIRLCWASLSYLLLGWGLWSSLIDSEGQAWHDRKSHSRLRIV